MTAGPLPDGGYAVAAELPYDAEGGDAMIRVLIADDQAMVRQGFGALLAAQPDLLVVGDAADGAQAVAAARRLDPDVVLMDVRMPVLDGLEATRKLLGDRPAQRTPGAHPDHLRPGRLRVRGAARRAPAASCSRTRRRPTWCRRCGWWRPGRAARPGGDPPADRRVRGPPGPPPAPPDRRWPALTPRETEVLRLIARGRSNAEIAGDLVVAEQTVKTHVGRILAKLGLRDRAQAVVLAYETGLVAAGE